MSEKTTTTLPEYYFGNMNHLQKQECIKACGMSKSDFYRKLKKPGLFKVSQAREFIGAINKSFGINLTTNHFDRFITEYGEMVKKSKQSSHVH